MSCSLLWIRDWINLYNDFLRGDGTLKSKQELETEQINLMWWERIQLETPFNKDKKNKFYVKPTLLDIIFKETEFELIKKFYSILLSQEMEQESIKTAMIKWEQDCQELIQLEDWEKAWKENIKMLKSANLKEIFYKMVYRWHLTPNRLAKMFSGLDNNCWKCQENVGTHSISGGRVKKLRNIGKKYTILYKKLHY